jgi:hypothetical protein
LCNIFYFTFTFLIWQVRIIFPLTNQGSKVVSVPAKLIRSLRAVWFLFLAYANYCFLSLLPSLSTRYGYIAQALFKLMSPWVSTPTSQVAIL